MFENPHTNRKPTVAASIINFLANLHGLHEHSVDGRAAVVDLITGIAYVPNLNYEDGEVLSMIAPDGGVNAEAVLTYKVVRTYLVLYAEVIAITDSGTAKVQYEQIQKHFGLKTS